jgi:site-specific DNA recombinase
VKAGVYVRISRDIAGESLGVQRQEEDCRALAAQLDWGVVELYVDNDRSALKARPAYTQMLEDIARGHIGAILAWHPDRLYRRVTDLADLVQACKEHNTQVATVNAGHIDLSTPTGRLVAGLLAQVAMYEVEHKSERWSRSWQQAREHGRPPRTGNRMFGYTRDSEVIPEEKAIALELAGRVLAGDSLESALRWLEAAGIKTTRGNDWTAQNLKQFLTNPRLAGWSTLKGEIVGEGQWEPLLDRDTFEQLNVFLKSRTRAYVPRKSLLNGLIVCGREGCEMRLVTGGQTRAGGKRVRIYRCPNRAGMRGCGRTAVEALRVDELVEEYARLRLADPLVRENLERLSETGQGNAAEIVALEERSLELERELDSPGVPVSAITRAMERNNARIEELRAVQPVRSEIFNRSDWPQDLMHRVQMVSLVVKQVRILPPSLPSRNGFDRHRVDIVPR